MTSAQTKTASASVQKWQDSVSRLERRVQKLEQKIDYLSLPQGKLDMRKISSAVAEYYGIPLSIMLSQERSMEYVRPRQLAIYLCRQLLKSQYTLLGRHFQRDSGAARHAFKVIAALRKKDPGLNAAIESLTKQLRKSQKNQK